MLDVAYSSASQVLTEYTLLRNHPHQRADDRSYENEPELFQLRATYQDSGQTTVGSQRYTLKVHKADPTWLGQGLRTVHALAIVHTAHSVACDLHSMVKYPRNRK